MPVKGTVKNAYIYCEVRSSIPTLEDCRGGPETKLMKDDEDFLLDLQILGGFDLTGKAILGTRSKLEEDVSSVESEDTWKRSGKTSHLVSWNGRP